MSIRFEADDPALLLRTIRIYNANRSHLLTLSEYLLMPKPRFTHSLQFITTAGLASLVFAATAFQSLITDDTGTRDRTGNQLELSFDQEQANTTNSFFVHSRGAFA